VLTVCWGAKGGSGTTVVVAALGLALRPPATLVDLDGDLPTALGATVPSGAGVHDWLSSAADGHALRRLLVPVRAGLDLLPAGRDRVEGTPARWSFLATTLRGWAGTVVVDAGSGDPPAALVDAADHALLVVRPCFLALRRAAARAVQPSGVVLVREPGRALRPADVEHAVRAPVVATLTLDPAIARAVDSGLLTTRLPAATRRALGRLA
jgi:hypothetical protein